MRMRFSFAVGAAVLPLLGGSVVVAGQEQRRFSVKPAEVALPPGVAFGDYRRVIQPFENWTLICDENFKTKKKVCNISQTVVDQTGETAFSWSLAATQDGKPMMIMRVPSGVGPGKDIVLSFPDKPELKVQTGGCDAKVCVALLPVSPLIKEQVAKGGEARVGYDIATLGRIVVVSPLKGLSTALAAIK